MKIKETKINLAFIFLALAFFENAMGKEEFESDIVSAYGGEDYISIATGTRRSISSAPSVASLITEENIKEIGATTIDEVLESVPGIHVMRDPIGYRAIYVIRGMYSLYNPQVLVMIDGVPITNGYAGNRGWAFGSMPVNGIERIEIIRGPGSALYGADAFSGVINIITKNSDDIRENVLGARLGSRSDREVWFQTAEKLDNGVGLSLSVEAFDQLGDNSVIERDAQTSLDNVFGTDASLAPGPVNRARKGYDVRVNVSKSDLRWRLGVQKRELGMGAGTAQALDPTGRLYAERINTDLSYTTDTLKKDWLVRSQVSFYQTKNSGYGRLFPSGAFGGMYPDGVIAAPEVNERTYRAGVQGVYSGLDDHSITLGAGLARISLYDVRESKNFNSDLSPIGSVVDVSATDPFVFEQERSNSHFYIQDEWLFAPDWTLTSGVRYDAYSDFGGSLNPRIAVIWQYSYDIVWKLMYGRAFRAPSFQEQYNRNNPIALGNPDLKPETVDTVELAYEMKFRNMMTTRFSAFGYKIKDQIRFVPNESSGTSTAQNAGGQDGYGFEVEAEWKPTDRLSLIGNYAYQRAQDASTRARSSMAPGEQVYARAVWQIKPELQAVTQATWVHDRVRSTTDTRENIDDYMSLDFGITKGIKEKNLAISLYVKNLLDEDRREPSEAPGNIPGDYPMGGRSWFIEAKYFFE